MTTPQNANHFIEQELDRLASAIEGAFSGDVFSYSGPILYGADDVIRATIENLKRRKTNRDKLVVMLSTDGGYIEVVQRIVDTFRYHYDMVDFIVPNAALSAGTVLVLSGDSIHMNYYSRLGPIDPQVEGDRGSPVPALGYLIQWDRLLAKAQAGTLTHAEVEVMIYGFDQGELYQYEQARELTVSLLKDWLVKYKFKDWMTTEGRKLAVTDEMKTERAEQIAKELNRTDRWHSHGYGISMEVLRRELNLRIDDFDAKLDIGEKVGAYHNLFSDYMMRRGNSGALHMVGTYLPLV